MTLKNMYIMPNKNRKLQRKYKNYVTEGWADKPRSQNRL